MHDDYGTYKKVYRNLKAAHVSIVARYYPTSCMALILIRSISQSVQEQCHM